MAGNLSRHLTKRQTEVAHHKHDTQNNATNQAEGLQRIGPHDRLHTTLTSVEPNEQHHNRRIQNEGQIILVENEQLQHCTNHVCTQRSTQHLTDEEEPSARLVRQHTETSVEILIERHHIHLVEQRNQHESDDQVTHEEAQHHLHIRETIGCNRAGNRDECYARNCSTHHCKCSDVPRCFTSTCKEACVIGLATRPPSY